MASRKMILSSLRLFSSSPHGYFFNPVTQYCSAVAAPPPQTLGKKEHKHEHEHEHGVGCTCRCVPTSTVIENLKRKTGRNDIDKAYIFAMMKREKQLVKDIYRKLDELKEKEFGSDVEKNDRLLKEMLTATYEEYDNINKVVFNQTNEVFKKAGIRCRIVYKLLFEAINKIQ
ncbi:hypothetical protein OROGR_009096 [Orobanche gracilis]